MIRLYPSSIQFHCGVTAGCCLLLAGYAGWNHDWAWALTFVSIALAGVLASAVIATREG